MQLSFDNETGWQMSLTKGACRTLLALRRTLVDANGGTEIIAVHDNPPPALSAADNETGWQMSLTKLAALSNAAEARDARRAADTATLSLVDKSTRRRSGG